MVFDIKNTCIMFPIGYKVNNTGWARDRGHGGGEHGRPHTISKILVFEVLRIDIYKNTKLTFHVCYRHLWNNETYIRENVLVYSVIRYCFLKKINY